MKMLVPLSLAIAVLLPPAAVRADLVVPLVDPYGTDSGWDAVLADDIHTGVVVDRVTDEYVRVEIFKDLYEGPVGGAFGANLITFRQRLDDAVTVATLQINDESVVNDTGVDWTDYHWEVLEGPAAFDRDATDASGFSIAPFTNPAWGPAPSGWTSGHSLTLDVDGGTVSPGETFTPGIDAGKLYIDVDLAGDDAELTLKQFPTPEPASAGLLGGGALLVLLRRSRRRRRA